MTCAICDTPIEAGHDVLAIQTGEVRDYGSGPLFSVLGHRGVFHRECLERALDGAEGPPGGGGKSLTSTDKWIDEAAPIRARVATAASHFDTVEAMVGALEDGSITTISGVGEKTAARLAALLLGQGRIDSPPGYLPNSLVSKHTDPKR